VNALVKNKKDNRALVHVHTTPGSKALESHDLTHFFTETDAARDVGRGMLKVKKHNHKILAAHAVSGGLDGLQAFMTGYDAIHMAESKASPEDYTNQISEDLNILPNINVDPEYRWSDSTAPEPVKELAEILKSHERRQEDRRMARLDRFASIEKGDYKETASGDLVDSEGVVYNAYP
jgi:hypothetical protein